MILYGGGWNAQRDPVDKKLVKPYYGYYGLEATDSPWKFKVRNAAQKIPAPDRSAHKGKKLQRNYPASHPDFLKNIEIEHF